MPSYGTPAYNALSSGGASNTPPLGIIPSPQSAVQASYGTSQRGTGPTTVNFTPGMYQGRYVSTPEEFRAQDDPKTRMGGPVQPGNNPLQSSPATVSPDPYPGDPTRQQAMDYLGGLGYTNPDEQEIQGAVQSMNSTVPALNNQFKEGFNQANKSGQVVPQSGGQALGAVGNFMPVNQPPQGQTPAEIFTQTDPYLGQIIKQWQEYMSPQSQRTSLTDEYKKLTQESGIQELNTELINVKNVIEGTEDDIRNEITKAGGFATESQVMAMTNSRNKQLIKNYNTLLETRNSKQEYVNTMISLTEKDRSEADARFDKNMNFSMQLLSYRDKMQDNARQSYQSIINKVGYGGLSKMTEGNPYYASMIESTLGLGNGGLAMLASLPDPEEADKALERQYKKAQIANIYSSIGEREKDGTIMVDTQGKVVPKPSEAMKINKELVTNDAYKSIQKGKDSLQFLTSFEDKFNKTGATSAVFSPRKNADLKAKYNATILNLKEFFNLGVLNGPDEAILRSVLPDPTNRSAFLTAGSLGIYSPSSQTRAGIDNLKKMIETSLDDRYKSLSSQYGDYSPQSINSLGDLNRIYVEQKARINPEIQKLIQENPDLTIEDITNIILQ